MFLFGLVAGSLSDRFSRPRLMAIGQSSNLAASSAMAVLLILDAAQFWHAYVMIFITGTTWALDYASRRALLGEIFSGKALTNATSLDAGLVTGTNMIGPLLGTLLIRVVDFEGAYIGIALLTVGAFSIVLSIRSRGAGSGGTTKRGSPLTQFRESMSLLRTNRVLLGAVLVTIVFNMLGWPFVQMVSVIGRDHLGVGEVGFGLLLSALGAGSLTGAALLAWAQPASRGNVYVGGTAIHMVAAGAFALAPWYPLALLAMFVAGVGLAAFATMQPVIPLEAVAPDQRGRAMGAIVLGIGFQAVGLGILGLAAEAVGPRIAILIMVSLGLVVLFTLRSIFPALRDEHDPTSRAERSTTEG
jgi:predicted MFS family arabinose efflux permease